MKFSTKTRYGSRAMVELAAAYPDHAVSVKDVACKQHLSPKYLEQIMSSLKNSGLVRSVRGMHGGYALTKPPGEISLVDIFLVLEGSTAPVECIDNADTCSMMNSCPTRDTWIEVKDAITEVLRGTTLQGLLDRMHSKARATAAMYNI